MTAYSDVTPLLANTAATGAQATWPGGMGLFDVVATAFAGASVTLQRLGPDGSTWLPVGPDTTLAANGQGIFTLPPGPIRAAISGGPPTAVYANVTRLRA